MDATAEEIRYAAGRNQIEPRFRPVVDLESGAVAAFEARAHWRHPALGVLPPDAVARLALEAGVADEIDRWALERACAVVAGWGGEALDALGFVSVGLGASTALAPGLCDHARAAADVAGLPPSHLVLEPRDLAVAPAPFAADLRRTGLGLALPTGLEPPLLLVMAAVPEAGRAMDPDAIEAVGDRVGTAGHVEALRAAGVRLARGPRFGGFLEAEAARALLTAGAVPVAG